MWYKLTLRCLTSKYHYLKPTSLNQIQMTEQSYSFRGIFTDKNYSTRLNYMAENQQDAWNGFAKLNPTFLVQSWGFEGQVD